jgi:hypothetical protein
MPDRAPSDSARESSASEIAAGSVGLVAPRQITRFDQSHLPFANPQQSISSSINVWIAAARDSMFRKKAGWTFGSGHHRYGVAEGRIVIAGFCLPVRVGAPATGVRTPPPGG